MRVGDKHICKNRDLLFRRWPEGKRSEVPRPRPPWGERIQAVLSLLSELFKTLNTLQGYSAGVHIPSWYQTGLVQFVAGHILKTGCFVFNVQPQDPSVHRHSKRYRSEGLTHHWEQLPCTFHSSCIHSKQHRLREEGFNTTHWESKLAYSCYCWPNFLKVSRR